MDTYGLFTHFLTITSSINVLYLSFGEHMSALLLGIYLGMELQVQMRHCGADFQMTVLILTLTSGEKELWLLSNLPKSSSFHSNR
jgi:hypothetical protein